MVIIVLFTHRFSNYIGSIPHWAHYKQIPGCQVFSAANNLFGIPAPMCSQHRSRSLREVMHMKCNCWHAGISSISQKKYCTNGCLKEPACFFLRLLITTVCVYSILYRIASAKKFDIYHLSSLLTKSSPCFSAAPVPFSCGYYTAVGSSCSRASRAWWKAVFFPPFYSITAHLGLW